MRRPRRPWIAALGPAAVMLRLIGRAEIIGHPRGGIGGARR